MMISVVVVYEQDVGLKSSIIVDTASFNPAGVYQLPITRLRTHAHHSQSGPLKALIEELSREIRNDRSLKLTMNKSGWSGLEDKRENIVGRLTKNIPGNPLASGETVLTAEVAYGLRFQ